MRSPKSRPLNLFRAVLPFSILPLSFFLCTASPAETVKAVFQGDSTEFRWPLNEINPDLPSDWSGYEYLTLELRSSTAQRFELRIHVSNGLRHVRLQPFQGAWIRAAIPLAYFRRPDLQGFDLASLGNKSRASYWINLMGSYGPLEAVESIGLAMQNPIGSPVIEIRSIRLDKQSPGDAVLETKPLVDQFGQWIAQDWPG
jgi:hypothetical protein